MSNLLAPPAADSRPNSRASSRAASRVSHFPAAGAPARARPSQPSARLTNHAHQLVSLFPDATTTRYGQTLNGRAEAVAKVLDSGKHNAPLVDDRSNDARIKGLVRFEVTLDVTDCA